MSIEVKQKIKEVADDFAMPAKKLIEIVGKFYEKPKSSSQNLTEDQLNVIFDYITQQNQIDSIEQVFAAAAAKKEAPAPAPAPAPAAPAAPAQSNQPRPQQQNQQPRPQQNNVQRPAQPQGGQNQPRPQQTAAQPAAKQPQPERILSGGRLRDHVIRPHGGQKAEHGTLRIAALRRQLLERQRPF